MTEVGVGQVARMLAAAGHRLSTQTIRRAIDRGDLRGWRTPGGHRKATPAEVRAWAARRGWAAVVAAIDAGRGWG